MERGDTPSKAPSPWALHATLVGVQLAFAAMAVSAHTALEHIPPLQFAAVRIMLGLPGLAALAWREGGALTWRMAAWGVPLSVGMVGAQILVFVCNHWVGTAPTGALQPIMPVFCALLSWAARLERMTTRKAIGVTLSVSGALAVAWPEGGDWGTEAGAAGYALLVFQVSLYAVYLVCLGAAMRDCGKYPFMFLYVATLIGWAVTMPFATPGLLALDLEAIPWTAWAACAYAGVAVTCAAHALNSWAVGHVSPTLPSLYNGVQVAGVFLGAGLVLGERITAKVILGSFAIVAGVAVACSKGVSSSNASSTGMRRSSLSLSNVTSYGRLSSHSSSLAATSDGSEDCGAVGASSDSANPILDSDDEENAPLQRL